MVFKCQTWTLSSAPQDMNNSKVFSDEAANIYERAIGTLLKKNMLLYFSFADYEEVSCTNTNHLSRNTCQKQNMRS